MTKETLKEMRKAFDKLVSEFSLDNLCSERLVEKALIIERAAAAGEFSEIPSYRCLKNSQII